MAEEYLQDVIPAGILVFRSTDQPGFERERLVYPHAELDIGRSFIQDALGVEDRSISKHHLRIRCVGYDDQAHCVTPLIYARVLSGNTAFLSRYGLDDSGDGIDLGREQRDVLLNAGDRMRLTNNITVELRSIDDVDERRPVLGPIREAEMERFNDRYRVAKRVLGAGGNASVFVAVKTTTSQQFACKIVKIPTKEADLHGDFPRTKERIAAELREAQVKTVREYDLLKNLSHPNIIGLEKVIRTPHSIYIFQELITGGDLLSYIERTGPLPEPQGAMIVRQLLEAVKYLHKNQIAHRDIKPENVLMTCWKNSARIVLTDFGQSRTFQAMEIAAKKAGVLRMQSMVGTHGYTAPEIYRQAIRDLQGGAGYSQAVDIWSIGCVTAIVLTNEPLFPDIEDWREGILITPQINDRLRVFEVDSKWTHIGHRAKSFIKGCLTTDGSQRLTAEQCLALPWFQHPYYKAEFDAAYKHTISDWSPRYQEDDIIEVMDTSDLGHLEQDSDDEDITSRHFQPAPIQPPHQTSKAGIDGMIARFRPHDLHVSPVHMPDSIDFDEIDDLDRNLDLASQNTAANIAALHVHARQAPHPTQRKRIYR